MAFLLFSIDKTEGKKGKAKKVAQKIKENRQKGFFLEISSKV